MIKDNLGWEETTPNGATPEKENSATLEELQAKHKRLAEQYEWSTAEAKKQSERASALEDKNINIATDMVERDNSYLKKLHESDPDLAEKVAKKFGKTYREALEAIEWADLEMKKPEIDKESFKREILEEAETKAMEKQVKEFVKEFINKLPESKQKSIKEEYEDLSEWKKMTINKAKKYLEMTSFFSDKDTIDKDTLDAFVAWSVSTSLWQATKKQWWISSEAKALWKSLWFNL